MNKVDKTTKTALNEVIKLFSQTNQKILSGFKAYGVLDNNSSKDDIEKDILNRASLQLETPLGWACQVLVQSSLKIAYTTIHISSRAHKSATITGGN